MFKQSYENSTKNINKINVLFTESEDFSTHLTIAELDDTPEENVGALQLSWVVNCRGCTCSWLKTEQILRSVSHSKISATFLRTS